MAENEKPPLPQPPVPPQMIMNVGDNPADVFIACVVKAGTDTVAVISDGKKSHVEYLMMLTAAMNGILVQLGEEMKKERGSIVTVPPGSTVNHRPFYDFRKPKR